LYGQGGSDLQVEKELFKGEVWWAMCGSGKKNNRAAGTFPLASVTGRVILPLGQNYYREYNRRNTGRGSGEVGSFKKRKILN